MPRDSRQGPARGGKRDLDATQRRSEASYREIFELATDMIVIQDIRTGEILDVNAETSRATGYSREELIRMGVAGFSPTGEEFAPEKAMMHAQRAASGKPQLFEWAYVDKAGRQHPTEVHLKRVLLNNEPRLLGIVRDISERRRVEELALKRSATMESINRLLRDILDSETEEEASRKALAQAQRLTDSEFGFIAELNQAGRLDTIAISDTGWEACQVPSGQLLLAGDLEVRGIRGLVIQQGRALRFNDPRSHEAWIEPPKGHPPLQAFLGVPLWLGERILGMIGLANKPGGYDQQDVEAIAALSASFTEALMRKRAELSLRDSLAEKEVLLSEVHHRVKNNLQVITSLLNLQARRAESEGMRELLRESRNRVLSMALTHEQLYRSQDLARVDFRRYLRELCSGLFRSYGTDPRRIELQLAVDDVALAIDQAIPCGLIVNELVSNCLKHAFPKGAQGRIRVGLSAAAGDRLALVVADNGVGLPPDMDPARAKSLGLRLVTSLAEQLGGGADINTEDGASFRVIFSATARRQREVGDQRSGDRVT